MQLQTKGGTEAKSTTQAEMEDLLHCVCTAFHKKTGHWPYLSFDNASIQAKIDVTCIRRDYHDPVQLPADHNLHIPNYSPDINRAVEHQFGGGKPRVRNACYMLDHVVTTAKELRKIACMEFTKNVPPGSMKRNVEGLPLLWEQISTPLGISWQDAKGHIYQGTGGNWGPRGSM
jgi:hypothetical protein